MKKLIWLGSSLNDLKAFPAEVQDEVGYALHCAQMGNTDSSVKPFRGYGSGVNVKPHPSISNNDNFNDHFSLNYLAC